jgi:hypothetical protein
MAIKIGTSKENIKVICKSDDSLAEDLTNEEWAAYQESLDETKLKFVEGKKPTRFVLTKNLSFGAQQAIVNQQMSLNAEGKPEIKLGFILEEIRSVLVGIENPDNIPEDEKIIFKKESDGFASKELIASLYAAGIVMELYGVRQAFINKGGVSKK